MKDFKVGNLINPVVWKDCSISRILSNSHFLRTFKLGHDAGKKVFHHKNGCYEPETTEECHQHVLAALQYFEQAKESVHDVNKLIEHESAFFNVALCKDLVLALFEKIPKKKTTKEPPKKKAANQTPKRTTSPGSEPPPPVETTPNTHAPLSSEPSGGRSFWTFSDAFTRMPGPYPAPHPCQP